MKKKIKTSLHVEVLKPVVESTYRLEEPAIKLCFFFF